jgi:hypothetical protein
MQWEHATLRPWWRRNLEWLIIAAAIAAIAAAVLTDRITHQPGSASAAAGSSTPTAPADGGTYADTDAVLAALADAGIPCTAPSAVADPTRSGATSMTDCNAAGSPDSDTVLVVFDNHADAYAYAQAMTDPSWVDTIGTPIQVVYGVNWAVNTIPGYGAEVVAALGGSTMTGTPSPTTSP